MKTFTLNKIYKWLFTYEVYNYFDGYHSDVYSRFTNKFLYRKYH